MSSSFRRWDIEDKASRTQGVSFHTSQFRLSRHLHPHPNLRYTQTDIRLPNFAYIHFPPLFLQTTRQSLSKSKPTIYLNSLRKQPKHAKEMQANGNANQRIARISAHLNPNYLKVFTFSLSFPKLCWFTYQKKKKKWLVFSMSTSTFVLYMNCHLICWFSGNNC